MPKAPSSKSTRAIEIIERLRAAYPDAHCELNFSNALELLVATILSAQTTDKQVNVVTADLFQKYRRASDYASAPLPQLEEDLKRIGLFRNKAKAIQKACQILVEKYGGEVPGTMDQLRELPGVGRKTANVVLGNVFNVSEGVVVDTHVGRLSQRLGLTREIKPEKVEDDLMRLVPREHWTMFSHWIIWHGRRRCGARNPDCPNCELADICPSKVAPKI